MINVPLNPPETTKWMEHYDVDTTTYNPLKEFLPWDEAAKKLESCKVDIALIDALHAYLHPHIVNVIFNGPATIVFWSDNTKTVVVAHNEVVDREKGLAMAIAKKALGNKGNYYNEIKKWLKEDE